MRQASGSAAARPAAVPRSLATRACRRAARPGPPSAATRPCCCTLWVSGTTLDWAAYGLTPGARRVSLPTYAFAREHFWLTLPYRPGAMDPPRAAPVLHPLLHANTSNLDGLRLSARLRGEEFFLADHVVQGRRVLPGVAYLEMARAALAELSPAPEGAAAVLTNVVWSRPFALDDAPASLHIGLVPHEDGRLAFSIHSDAGVHSQGSARWDPAPVAETLDLDALRASMGRAEFSPAQCYDAFAELGLAYGPGHRGLAAVYAGEDAVLARLALPVAAPGGVPAFVLHPGVMDSALQASVAFLLGEDGSLRDSTTVLPFAARARRGAGALRRRHVGVGTSRGGLERGQRGAEARVRGLRRAGRRVRTHSRLRRAPLRGPAVRGRQRGGHGRARPARCRTREHGPGRRVGRDIEQCGGPARRGDSPEYRYAIA